VRPRRSPGGRARGGRESEQILRRWSGPAAAAAELNADERDEAAGRGSLVVADKAVERIAQAAVLEVSGVVNSRDSTGAIASALGRAYPRVDVHVAGRHASVDVDVLTRWPRPAAQVAAAVREHVAERLHTLADLDVTSVDVKVAKVVRPSTPERKRVQ